MAVLNKKKLVLKDHPASPGQWKKAPQSGGQDQKWPTSGPKVCSLNLLFLEVLKPSKKKTVFLLGSETL